MFTISVFMFGSCKNAGMLGAQYGQSPLNWQKRPRLLQTRLRSAVTSSRTSLFRIPMLFSERLTEDSMKKLGNPNHLRRSVAFHLELVGVLVRLSLQEQLSPQWPRALAFKVGSGPCLIVLRHVQHTHTCGLFDINISLSWSCLRICKLSASQTPNMTFFPN